MTNKILSFRLILVLILGLSVLSFSTFAKADSDRGEKSRHGH